MPAIIEYNNSLERDSDILFREYEIAKNKIFNEYFINSCLYDDYENFFEDGEQNKPTEKKKNGFVNFITKITDAIMRFIKDVKDMFVNMFSKKENIDIEAYLNSSTGEIQLDYDLKKVEEQVNDEVRKGRKLIQAISKGTGVSDKVVEEYVDRAAVGIKDHGKTIIKSARAYSLFQHANKGLDDLKKETNEVLKECKNSIGKKDKEVPVARVYGAMHKWFDEALNAYKFIGNRVYLEALREKNKQEANK